MRVGVAVLVDLVAGENGVAAERRDEVVDGGGDQRPAPAKVDANGRLIAFSSPTHRTRRWFHG